MHASNNQLAQASCFMVITYMHKLLEEIYRRNLETHRPGHRGTRRPRRTAGEAPPSTASAAPPTSCTAGLLSSQTLSFSLLLPLSLSPAYSAFFTTIIPGQQAASLRL